MFRAWVVACGTGISGLGCFGCLPRAVALADLTLEAVALGPVGLALLLGVALILNGMLGFRDNGYDE